MTTPARYPKPDSEYIQLLGEQIVKTEKYLDTTNAARSDGAFSADFVDRIESMEKSPANEAERHLFAFYAATSRTNLIAQMSEHIDRLQAKLTPISGSAITKPRFA